MKIHFARAVLAVVSAHTLDGPVRDPVRSRGSRMLARKGGNARRSKILNINACPFYRRMIISSHDTIDL